MNVKILSKMNGKVSVSFLVLLLCATRLDAELFTALSDLETLLSVERTLISTVDEYLLAEEQRISEVRNALEAYRKVHMAADSLQPENFVLNPVNAFVLLKRLTRDWKNLETAMQNDHGKDYLYNITLQKAGVRFPDEEDLTGAAVALMRLQETYNLDTAAIAEGRIKGAQDSSELRAADCYELGRQSYYKKDYRYTVLWMEEALKRLMKEPIPSVAKSDILEYLAFSVYQRGDVQKALDLTYELLRLVPDHTRALGNVEYYLDELRELKEKRKGETLDEDVPVMAYASSYEKEPAAEPDAYASSYEKEPAAEPDVNPKSENVQRYEILCRGDDDFYYTNKGHPYLLLRRVKMEEAYLDPWIVIFHDVIYEEEINVIKELATPQLARATVQNPLSGKLETAEYRVSKSAWLDQGTSDVVDKYVARIEAITGLTASTAEALQVANYGLGGHYEPHYDFSTKDDKDVFPELGTGNRVATWLTYLARATVQNPLSGKLETAEYRVSKSAWLDQGTSDVVDKYVARIEAITGLTASTAEALQVANYGLGGHYEPHYDFSTKDDKDKKGLNP
ncbi:unnamed protein product [Cyprideis torosa]|uniref:procollagen-proline 4-dioxygenase n=1 Tax=Cyprideis torosa TaxID=163714 RepID=A0A7R8WAH5_9CRUS|nr:unnamed protein product [Cyprideis torosa]CAG0885330.1 unnamed protein product [Cyprideis torosa]